MHLIWKLFVKWALNCGKCNKECKSWHRLYWKFRIYFYSYRLSSMRVIIIMPSPASSRTWQLHSISKHVKSAYISKGNTSFFFHLLDISYLNNGINRCLMNFICLLTGLVLALRGCKLFFDLKEARKIELSYWHLSNNLYIIFFWIEM